MFAILQNIAKNDFTMCTFINATFIGCANNDMTVNCFADIDCSISTDNLR